MQAMHTKPGMDNKAERMLDIYESQRFGFGPISPRVHLTLVLCVMCIRFLQSLKRILDMLVTGMLIVLSLPLMLVTILAIKLDSPGPILFRQIRVGKWGRTFTCYKFRSMYIDAERRLAELREMNEVDGPVFKIKNDPRVTKVGRVIRKLSIDELPQLYNVLKGEMSLVGPRPALPHEVAQYTYDEIRRLNAMPGITGLQQVSGRSNIDFQRWIELDLQYISEQSFWKDLQILFKTIPAVLFSKGAY
jgi:exopolysaccharide biosynthesis polyprenyl glycosylphosphotransferase